MAGPYTVFYRPDEDPGSRFAPEVNAEIATVAPSAVTNGSITSAKIAPDAVTTEKIDDGAVTSPKIGTKEVKTVNIADEAVGTAQLDDDAVTAAKAGLGVVTTHTDGGTPRTLNIVEITDDAYAALSVKDPNTLYLTYDA